MLISVIIPVYNEARTIKQVVESVLALDFNKEVIVIDDGSTDGTFNEVVKLLDNNSCLRLYSMGHNSGKGAALRQGIYRAKGNVIVFQDADLEYDPRDIPKVVAPILSGQAKACYGSRIDSKGFLSAAHKQINRFLSNLTSQTLTDMETGMKAFRAATIKALDLESTGFEIEPEITIKLLQHGVEIAEVPISYNARTAAEGKKIGVLDGIKALLVIGKLRIRYARPSCRAS